MKPLTLSDPAIILGLQDEIRRSDEARYDHRLHGLLLVARGLTAGQVALHFGESRTAVWGWVKRFNKHGLAGLSDGERTGRPPRLNEKQLREVDRALRAPPPLGGLWDGKTLAAYIRSTHGVRLGVRQCQRLFRKLGFRLRKPRPALAHGDPQPQKTFKKN